MRITGLLNSKVKIRINYMLSLLFILPGCAKVEIIDPEDINTNLIVNWDHRYYDSGSNYESAMISIYDNEKKYLEKFGKPVAKYSWSQNEYKSDTIFTKTFTKLIPGRYWIKIFNADYFDRIIEHNQNKEFIIADSLIKNSSTTVTVETEEFYLDSYSIKEIEFIKLPDWILNSSDHQLYIYFFEYFNNTFLLKEEVFVENSKIIYRPYEMADDLLKYLNYSVLIADTPDLDNGSHNLIYYELLIFDLMNTNASMGEEFIHLDLINQIDYRIVVDLKIHEL